MSQGLKKAGIKFALPKGNQSFPENKINLEQNITLNICHLIPFRLKKIL